MSTPFTTLFSSLSPTRVPRLALSLEALDKCGKTYWSLMTAPDPIAVVTNDIGTHAIVNLARAAGRKIYTLDIQIPPPPPDVKKHTDINKAEWDEWKKGWGKFKEAMASIVAEKSIRTLVRDTETEVWHLAELAYFGKLQGNQSPDVRTKLNADYTRSFWDLYNGRPDLNIILIHKQGKEYKKQGGTQADWTGEYEMKGYSGIGYMVDASLRMGWNNVKKDFYIEIPGHKTLRYGNPYELAGKQWWAGNEDYGFGYIAMEMWPETQDTPEYWGLV